MLVLLIRKVFATLLLAGSAVQAGELLLLRSGARMAALSHEVEGATTRVKTEHGVIELPSSEISAVEPDDSVAIPPPPTPASAATPTPAPANPPAQTAEEMLRAAAQKHGLPVDFVLAVARQESGLNPRALSPKGAIGLMQLMPGTARMLGVNPHDPQANADAGVRHLCELLEKYNYDARLALAAYNAGPGAVSKHRGVPPYRETQAYVRRIIGNFLKKQQSIAAARL